MRWTWFLSLLVIPLAGDALAQFRNKPADPQKTDYGPALASSLKYADKQWVIKGLTLRLDDGDAAVCFDTETLRPTVGWVNVPTLLGMNRRGWAKVLEVQGLAFTAALKPDGPLLRGQVVFTNPTGTGWSTDGNFDDPRPGPYGPLPSQRGRWKGLYHSGPAAVLSYDVAGVSVLETAGLERIGKLTALSRTIHVGPGPELLLSVCRANGAAGASKGDWATLDESPRSGVSTVVGVVGLNGPQWRIDDGRVVLRLPKRDAAITVKLLTGNLPKGEEEKAKELLAASPPPADLPALCKGGPPRWSQPITTKGRLGAGGAYVLDTIELPRNNPWNAVIRPTGIDFFPDGGAAMCTLSGDVWLVSGLDASLARVTWRRFAAGLHQPMGVRVVDGLVYVLCRDQITRLHDLNSDGEADFYENFNNDARLTELIHDFPLDLQTDAEGNFYYGRCGTGLEPYDRVFEHHGAILKVSTDGTKTEVIARGLRVPNGLCVSPDGLLTCADNEGSWSPASRINLLRPGKFYGDMRVALGEPKPTDFEKPIVWFPRSFDTSPAAQVWAPKEGWGPLSGQMLTLSYGTSSLNWVMLDRVGDVVQGAAVRWPVKFDSGMIRARFGPGGHLYACGLRGWQTNATAEGALQRVRWTGADAVVPVGWRATKVGFVVTFSGKLDPKATADAGNWAMQRWEYKWGKDYGSKEYSMERPGVAGRDDVEVTSVELLDGGRSVLVKPAKQRTAMQVSLKYVLGEVKGEIIGTVNALGD